MSDSKRRTVAGTDHQIAFAFEHDSQCKGAAQAAQNIAHGINGLGAILALAVEQMSNHFRVSLRQKLVAVGNQLFLELSKIFDDTIVDDHHIARDMGMGVHFIGHTMGGPARMADAARALQRCFAQTVFQIA